MPLFRRQKSKPSFVGSRRVDGEKDRARQLEQLRSGLDELARRAEDPTTTVFDVQLVLQAVGPAGYAAYRADREKAFRKQGLRLTTDSWPDSLEAEQIAVLLLPISAGRVGPGVGRHPKPITTPLFSVGTPPPGVGPYDAALGLVNSWVNNPSGNVSARLGPPVIEVLQNSRVQSRAVETFGLDWPLPRPDGI
jgi:hypothetical protein